VKSISSGLIEKEFSGLVLNNKINKKHIIKAGSWVLIGHLVSQLLRLGGNLILTRLLVPEMFGVMAIVNVVFMGVQMFSDLGLGQSIIQSKRGDEPAFINTAWTLQVIRGFLIWFFICLIAGLLWGGKYLGYLDNNNVYAYPLLPWLIAAAGFAALISGFNSMSIFLVNRNLMLGRVTIINLTAQLVSLCVIVAVAWRYETIWALAVGGVISSTIEMACSHKFLPGIKNRFHWDKTALNELFNFGKWIFFTSIVSFLAVNYERLVLGQYLTSSELGIYSIAMFLSVAVLTAGSRIAHSVLFPRFSEVFRNEPEKLKDIYYQSKKQLHFFLFPIAGCVFVWAPVVIELLYDNRYQYAGEILQILMVGTFILFLTLPSGSCLMAMGSMRYSFVGNAMSFLTLVVGMPIVWKSTGVIGVLWLTSFAPISRMLVGTIGLYCNTILSFWNELFSLFLLVFGVGLGVASLYLFRDVVGFDVHIIGLIGLIG